MSWAGLACVAMLGFVAALPYLQQRQQLVAAQNVVTAGIMLSNPHSREILITRLQARPAFPDEVANLILDDLKLEKSDANRVSVRSDIIAPYIESGVLEYVTAAGPDKGKLRLVRQPNFATALPFYCTDRNRIGGSTGPEQFGNGFAELTCGVAQVSIPREHRMGVMERPNFLRLEFKEDPERYVVVMGAQALPERDFVRRLQQRRVPGSSNTLVYVPGYNTSFNQTSARLGTMAYDLGINAGTVAFSWPSAGSATAYSQDQEASERASADFAKVVQRVLDADAHSISIVSEGMGARVVVGGLRMLASNPIAKARFGEMVFIVPDIDAELFAHDAETLVQHSQRVTVYTCDNCPQIIAASSFAGIARAGDSSKTQVAIPGEDVIALTDDGALKHTYYSSGASEAMLRDLFQALRGVPADKRIGLRRVSHGSQGYWSLMPSSQ